MAFDDGRVGTVPLWTLMPVTYLLRHRSHRLGAPRRKIAGGPADITQRGGRPAFAHDPTFYDGMLIGADGAWKSGTPLSELRGVRPSNGAPATHRIIYVNGIINTPDMHFDSLQAVADAGGAEVLGIYNATEGLPTDLVQATKDKADVGRNQAVDTLAHVLRSELMRDGGGDINLMVHSHGAIVASRAIGDVKGQMVEEGLTVADAEAKLKRVRVDTFGAAAWSYPDGPSYHHYVNTYDPIVYAGPRAINPADPLRLSGGLGAGAKVTEFKSTAGNHHELNKVYIPNWQPRFAEPTPVDPVPDKPRNSPAERERPAPNRTRG